MILIRNCRMIDPASGTDGLRDILTDGSRILKIGESGSIEAPDKDARIIEADGLTAAPGLVDTHVHFRDPGAEYKEDIFTGAKAAAAGGFTSVVLMANTTPHVDNEETLSYVIEKGKKTGIHVYTCANVTMDMAGDELTDMETLAKAARTWRVRQRRERSALRMTASLFWMRGLRARRCRRLPGFICRSVFTKKILRLS